MVIKKVVIEFTPDEEGRKSELIDVVASITRKKKHMPFGRMIRVVASAVKQAVGTDNWNRKWALAAKLFSLLWDGRAPDQVRSVAPALGSVYGLDADTSRRIAETVIAVFASARATEGIWASHMYRGGGANAENSLGSTTP